MASTRVGEFKSSGFATIVAGYAALLALNLLTLQLGPTRVIVALSAVPWGGLLGIVVFDSWGTIAGLLGSLMFYCIIVIATDAPRRRELSMFILLSTILEAILAGLVWDGFLDTNVFLGRKLIGEGASTVPIAGEATVIVLSTVGLVDLLKGKAWRTGRLSDTVTMSWGALFLTIIVVNLAYVLFLQPIFVPTSQYNWRAHEISFVFGGISTAVYVILRRVPVASFTRGVADTDAVATSQS